MTVRATNGEMMPRMLIVACCLFALLCAAGALDYMAAYTYATHYPISVIDVERQTGIELPDDSEVLIHAYHAEGQIHQVLIRVPHRCENLGEPTGTLDSRHLVEQMNRFNNKIHIEPLAGRPCTYYELPSKERPSQLVYQLETKQGILLIFVYEDIKYRRHTKPSNL